MSPNRGKKVKSSTLCREIDFAFDQKVHFFGGIDQKLGNVKKKEIKSYTFIKRKIHNFDC